MIPYFREAKHFKWDGETKYQLHFPPVSQTSINCIHVPKASGFMGRHKFFLKLTLVILSASKHFQESEQQWLGTAEQPSFEIGHRVKLIYFLDTVRGIASIRNKILKYCVYRENFPRDCC